MMLLSLQRGEFRPFRYNACAIRVYDTADLVLTDEEKNGTMAIRNGKAFIIMGTGKAWISKVAPDKDWMPPNDGKVTYQIFKPCRY